MSMGSWRQCSTCKKNIAFSSSYYECSVSTCTGKRTGYVFCSILCFETHLPGSRHRNAGAIEKRAPSVEEAEAMGALPEKTTGAPTSDSSVGESKANIHGVATHDVRRRIVPSSSTFTMHKATENNSDEILIVISKLKQYIREKSTMNTAGDVGEILSHFVRRLCDDAIQTAREDGRKTVMAKDFRLR